MLATHRDQPGDESRTRNRLMVGKLVRALAIWCRAELSDLSLATT